MKQLLVFFSFVFLTQNANAWFFFVPIPNVSKPPELQKIIDAYEKSSETKAAAFVSQDKTWGSKQWVWGHESGVMSQEQANRVALRTCENSLAKLKAQTAGGQPVHDFGQKRCELYKFTNETVSPPTPEPLTTTLTEPVKVNLSPTAKRLRELESLFSQKLITQEEYEKKRKEILYSF